MPGKHQPTRTCIACRTARPKRELVRVVRGLDGTITVDPTGKARGRGAYLCSQRPCWERALQNRALNRALKTTLDEAAMQQLREHASQYERETTMNG